MKNYRMIFILMFLITGCVQISAQIKPKASLPTAISNSVKSSAAYAEILLRKTELESTVEDLSVEYTEEYPKLKESRFELSALNKWFEKLVAVNANEAGKLTQALGKLILRKVELDTDVHFLLQRLGDQHPDVKRAKRKSEIFEKAIKEILP